MRHDLDQAVIRLAEELGRHRALTDEESLLLERSIRRVEIPTRSTPVKFWTPAEDRALIKAFRSREARHVAALLGRTIPSVNSRMKQLRKSNMASRCVRKRARRGATVQQECVS